LTIGLVATAGLAWFVTCQGRDISSIGGSILTSTYPDDVIPRLGIAAAFLWGSYRLVRAGSPRQVLAAAATCAIIGMLAAAYVIVRAELAFAHAFPNDGAAGGWAPGAARAEFLPVSYLLASVQAVWGLSASTVLLAISTLRRPAA